MAMRMIGLAANGGRGWRVDGQVTWEPSGKPMLARKGAGAGSTGRAWRLARGMDLGVAVLTMQRGMQVPHDKVYHGDDLQNQSVLVSVHCFLLAGPESGAGSRFIGSGGAAAELADCLSRMPLVAWTSCCTSCGRLAVAARLEISAWKVLSADASTTFCVGAVSGT